MSNAAAGPPGTSGERPNRQEYSPGPGQQRAYWFLTILVSASVSTLVGGLVEKDRDVANAVSRLAGHFVGELAGHLVGDLFPYLLFGLLQAGWALAWRQRFRARLTTVREAAADVAGGTIYLLVGPGIAAALAWRSGARPATIAAAAVLGLVVWVAAHVVVLAVLLAAGGERCPECRGRTTSRTDFTLDGGFESVVECTNPECGRSDARPVNLSGVG